MCLFTQSSACMYEQEQCLTKGMEEHLWKMRVIFVLFLFQNFLSLELSSDEERDEGRRRNGSLDNKSFINALSFLLKHCSCSQVLLYVNSWDTSNKQCSEGRRRKMGCKEASDNSSDLLLKVTSYDDCLTKDLSPNLRLSSLLTDVGWVS